MDDNRVFITSSYSGRAAETFDKQQLLRERRCAVGLPPPMGGDRRHDPRDALVVHGVRTGIATASKQALLGRLGHGGMSF